MTSPQQTFSVSKKPQKRILSGMFVAVNLLLLTGCQGYGEPLTISNTYFENLYSVKEWNGKIIQNKIPFNKEITLFGKVYVPVNVNPNYFTENYYQKDNMCYLFSYTTEDLVSMKEQAGFDKKSDDAIFMIKKNGITVISRAEYEKLKPTFKPHPYDASLCKPAPKTERKQI